MFHYMFAYETIAIEKNNDFKFKFKMIANFEFKSIENWNSKSS